MTTTDTETTPKVEPSEKTPPERKGAGMGGALAVHGLMVAVIGILAGGWFVIAGLVGGGLLMAGGGTVLKRSRKPATVSAADTKGKRSRGKWAGIRGKQRRATSADGARGRQTGSGLRMPGLRGSGTKSVDSGRLPGSRTGKKPRGSKDKSAASGRLRDKLPRALGGTGGTKDGAKNETPASKGGLRSKLPRALGGTRTPRGKTPGGKSPGGSGGSPAKPGVRSKLPRWLGGSGGVRPGKSAAGTTKRGRFGGTKLGRLFGDGDSGEKPTGDRKRLRDRFKRKNKIVDRDVGADDVLLDGEGKPLLYADGRPMRARRGPDGEILRDADGNPLVDTTPEPAPQPEKHPDAETAPVPEKKETPVMARSKASAPDPRAAVPVAGGISIGGGPLTALAEELASRALRQDSSTYTSRGAHVDDLVGMLEALARLKLQGGKVGDGWKDNGIDQAFQDVGRQLTAGSTAVQEAQSLWLRKIAAHREHIENPGNHGEDGRHGLDVSKQ